MALDTVFRTTVKSGGRRARRVSDWAASVNLTDLSNAHRLTTLHGMAKKVTSPAAKVVRERPDPAPKPAAGPAKPSALVDTRVIYCGDNLEQLKKLPDACVDLIYIDPPFNSNRNYEVFWGETKEKRSFDDRHASTQACHRGAYYPDWR